MRFLALAACAALVACAQPAPSVRALAADETSISGVVTGVEAGAYPLFTIHLTPATGEPLALYLNAESGADLGGLPPGAFADQTALVYFTSSERPFLLDLRTAEGRSLLYDDGRGIPTDGAAIVGALSGANAVTTSDLPGAITITSTDGAAQTFEFFVDRRIAAANGRQITAYYDTETRREITLMQAQAPR